MWFDKMLLSVQAVQDLGVARFRILDVRHDLVNLQLGQQLYVESHLPGAIFVDLENEWCGEKNGRNGRHPLPNREALAQRLAKKGIHKDDWVLVYDADNMMFASHAWWKLKWLGFSKVSVLSGGIKAWKQAGAPLVKGVEPPLPAVQWSLPSETMPVVDIAHVQAGLVKNSIVLLDARSPERYRGDVEPMDPIAGHIPGAYNHAFTLNLQSDGQAFLPVDRLKALYAPWLSKGKPLVHQCGSGVTACHNIFALCLCGYAPSALYVGSWSEWIVDPSRGVALGDQAGL